MNRKSAKIIPKIDEPLNSKEVYLGGKIGGDEVGGCADAAGAGEGEDPGEDKALGDVPSDRFAPSS